MARRGHALRLWLLFVRDFGGGRPAGYAKLCHSVQSVPLAAWIRRLGGACAGWPGRNVGKSRCWTDRKSGDFRYVCVAEVARLPQSAGASLRSDPATRTRDVTGLIAELPALALCGETRRGCAMRAGQARGLVRRVSTCTIRKVK